MNDFVVYLQVVVFFIILALVLEFVAWIMRRYIVTARIAEYVTAVAHLMSAWAACLVFYLIYWVMLA